MRICDRCKQNDEMRDAVAQINFDGVEIEETMDVCDECYQAVRELLVTPPRRQRKKKSILSLAGKED